MQSFFNGLSGMYNFSKSLDNISNNISNMNTPGFKGTDIFIRSLSDGSDSYGSQLSSGSIRLQSGDLRQTGNDTDLAILGEGYFVLQDANGKMFYSRAGQFKFDENNILVDAATGYKVMSLNSNGALNILDISEKVLLPPEATTEIKFIGNLDSDTIEPHEISNVMLYDESGDKQEIKVTFVKVDAPILNTWNVSVIDSLDNILTSFQIEFSADSTPLADSSKIERSITIAGKERNLTFDFGSPGSYSGTTQFISSTSDLAANVTDGHDAQGLRSISFKEDGSLELEYANGEKADGPQVALARFNDPSVLKSQTNGLLSAPSTTKPSIGKPNQGEFGSIQSKSIELSNVDLTQEFADILIVQRGYQASSRVMSVANDMLEQLYNTRSR
jgi:flagellar hook protein FlgE